MRVCARVCACVGVPGTREQAGREAWGRLLTVPDCLSAFAVAHLPSARGRLARHGRDAQPRCLPTAVRCPPPRRAPAVPPAGSARCHPRCHPRRRRRPASRAPEGPQLAPPPIHLHRTIVTTTSGPLALAPTVPPAARVPWGAQRFRQGSDQASSRFYCTFLPRVQGAAPLAQRPVCGVGWVERPTPLCPQRCCVPARFRPVLHAS